MIRSIVALAALLTGSLAWGAASKPSAVPSEARPPASSQVVTSASLVRVNSTNQSYDFFRPWVKKAPFYRRGLGVVVEGGYILVTAELITNHSYVELEDPITAAKCPAEIVRLDYDCNLALLKPLQEGFLKDARPLALDETAKVGDQVELLQLESTGVVAQTPGTITTITVAPYPTESLALLMFRLSSPLQGRESSFVIPVVRSGRLLGLVMRYDARNQTADVLPAPIIQRFLSSFEKNQPAGLPRVGIGYSATRDPQLRRYIGLTDNSGVYVNEVRVSSAADKAGIRRGDVILSVGGQRIDQDGNYEDPLFGRLSFSHLTSIKARVGDRIDFEIFRDGKKQTVPVTLEELDRSKIISESFVFDRKPRYFIFGGLVFQELSRPYLQEWGGNWMKDAPQRLVALDVFQNEQPADRGKIVFLSQVFPTTNTLGYEDLENLVVSKVNGTPIKSLDDLVKAVSEPSAGFLKIEFDDDPPMIVLDPTEAKKADEQVRKEYGVPELKNLD